MVFLLNRNRIEEADRLTKEAGVWNVPTNTLLENVFYSDNTTQEMKTWPGMEFMPESTVENWENAVTRCAQMKIIKKPGA